MTGLIPRDGNPLESDNGAFVGTNSCGIDWVGSSNGISGLLVNNEEEGKFRGTMGVAFEAVATGAFRFLFNGRVSCVVELKFSGSWRDLLVVSYTEGFPTPFCAAVGGCFDGAGREIGWPFKALRVLTRSHFLDSDRFFHFPLYSAREI